MSDTNNSEFAVIDDFSELHNNQPAGLSRPLVATNASKQSSTTEAANNVPNTLAPTTQNATYDDKIKAYLVDHTPVVYILTPCFASLCYVNFVHCLMDTIELFKHYAVPLHIEFCKNDSLVSRARNNLVARAMNDKKMTHMLFIDNDITWDPMDVLKLVIADKPIVGGIYPLKNYNWGFLTKGRNEPTQNFVKDVIDRKNKSQFRNVISDEHMIQYNLLKYNVNYLNNTLSVEKNLAEVKHLATGFMMIQRNVIEKMSKAFPSTKYVDDVNFLRAEENEFAYALFDCGVEEGHYFSEDWLFCHRWSKMKGRIWMDVTINLTHTGQEDYRGSFLSSII
jgi:acyl-CoA synthetase (AMP-forming)/AMP-acid ligase II